MMRKLPVGIQSFEKVRRDGFVYVDKTAYVHRLVQEGAPVFLSRPRRFGKSLLVSTLRTYLEGKRGLFEGLAIEQLEGDGAGAWQARPVLHLDFNGADYTKEGGLEGLLDATLSGFERKWLGAAREGSDFGVRFKAVIESAHEASGHRVAVLVDEYDKPLLESMHDPVLEESNRAALKGLYSVLEDADDHLHFAFLTGVTKFSKVSIFSDLNQLKDVSLDKRYAAICGITEPELLSTFGPEIGDMAEELGLTAESLLEKLRVQYDGYCFHPAGPGDGKGAATRKVYNPFSLLRALDSQEIGSYWFQTGTPTFLVRRMRDAELDPRRLVDGTIQATDQRLSDYRADDPDPVPLLFQAGYLTISGADARTGRYSLSVPNGEVERGLLEGLLPAWAPGYSSLRGTDVFSLLDKAEAGDTDGVRDVLAALFASIPYTREDDPFENYFQAVLWLVFTLLGRYVSTEVHQAQGRMDVVVEARSHVYVMELKRDGSAAEAIAQIRSKGYAAPLAADKREIHLVGAAFDSKTRQLSDWETAAA